MKKLFPILILVSCFFAAGTQAAGKMVFCDFKELIGNFYKTQLATDRIQQQEIEIKLERETLDVEIQQMKDEIEILRADSRDEELSEEVREGKRSLLEEKLIELQTRDREGIDYTKLRERQLKQQGNRMQRKLFDEVMEAVNKYAAEKGYAAVIDSSSQNRLGMRVIIYVDSRKDITGELLALLNKGEEAVVEKATFNEEQ